MKEETACMWIETAEFNSGGSTPMSYAVNGQNNKWPVFFRDTETVSVILGGTVVHNPGDLPLWSQRSGDFQKVSFTLTALLPNTA